MIQQSARNVGDSRAGSGRQQLVGRPGQFARHLTPVLAGIALLVLGCSEEDGTNSSNHDDAGSSNQGTNPRTIYELLDRINELPHPVQLPHVLESLDRPLKLNSTSNTSSAQPALGKRSPRIFIVLNETLIVSFVPGADPTLEFGERNAREPGVSVKGELHFPIEHPLAPEDAFTRLAPEAASGRTLDQTTRCVTCHAEEKPAPDYPVRGAFTSLRVKPSSFFAVDVAAIRRERDSCDSASERDRCAVLRAIFDHGDVVQTAFP